MSVNSSLIAIDGLKALQVAGDFAAEVTLEHPFVLGDEVKDLVELLFGKVRSAHVGIEPGFLDQEIGAGGPDAVDVTEGVRDFLLRGNIDAEETWHGWWLVES